MISERTIYTLAGVLLLVGTELLRWLASAPAELCTVLLSVAAMLMAGGPSLMRPPDQRGNVRLGLLLTVAGAALLALAFSSVGCGTREIRTDGPVMVEWWSGPPCRVVVVADGERVLDARSPVKCVLPGGE